MRFSDALKIIREERGLSQQAMADIFGIHRITLLKYENEQLAVQRPFLGHVYRNRFLDERERRILLQAGNHAFTERK